MEDNATSEIKELRNLCIASIVGGIVVIAAAHIRMQAYLRHEDWSALFGGYLTGLALIVMGVYLLCRRTFLQGTLARTPDGETTPSQDEARAFEEAYLLMWSLFTKRLPGDKPN